MSLFNPDQQSLLEYKHALAKRRERDTRDLDITRHDSKFIDANKTTTNNLNTFNPKNVHYKRMQISAAKNAFRKGIHSSNEPTLAGGQALPVKGHIRHVDIGRGFDKNRTFDHEIGHTHQMADAYRKGGTRGLFKAISTEFKNNTDKPTGKIFSKLGLSPEERYEYANSGQLKKDVSRSNYFKSGLEHNANNYAFHGDSKAVRKEREAVVRSRLKGVSAARKFDSKYSGTKNFDDQLKLSTLSSKYRK